MSDDLSDEEIDRLHRDSWDANADDVAFMAAEIRRRRAALATLESDANQRGREQRERLCATGAMPCAHRSAALSAEDVEALLDARAVVFDEAADLADMEKRTGVSLEANCRRMERALAVLDRLIGER